ncbi:alpha/beta fold hydrolase [Nonomuraea dietziae]|uniref:Pimeloyl-ACP methyl ester carboxylesterase n=1 Tax=Nonomuraea dietziae TaxID=65515 RepID=A0A7W5YQM5_9ACTN|nr:alpha/beta fold hydrolase [Nonomuraea dietziae]MBB3729772.1 pimeloyl-ACP methyl ester carboxylesterase [Nonomuraea dietziae]
MQNDIFTEEFGDSAHQPILLIAGSMSQGPASWPDAFVGRLAAGGRRVIRYDHRDTGRSATIDFATDPYTWHDIKNDALAVLDAHGIDAAHVVGHSAGGVLAQWIAVEHPERVMTLTTIGSSPLGRQEGLTVMRALMGEEQPEGSLPPPTKEFVEFYRKLITSPPPSTRKEQIDFQLAEARVLAGGLPIDEEEERRQAERLHDRARDLSALANHRLAAAADMTFEPVGVLHTVKAPTLVVEGTHEPAKPGHGALIAEAIPGAELLIVEGMGHMLTPQVHQTLADAVLRHTATVRG